MFLKQYRTQTLKEALMRIREDLGPDAIVLSTRVVDGPGWKGWMGQRLIEVTAAADRTVSETRTERQPERHLKPVTSHQDAILSRLRATGLDEEIASEIAAAVPTSRRRGASLVNLRDTLATRLAALAAGDESPAPVQVFVGPPGVGKTTTIAKIAAQHRARGGRRLQLVAADGYRVGAVEQLRLYADIIDAPFAVTRTPDELHDVLGASRGPVLVDTAGRSPADPGAREFWDALSGHKGVQTHLVVAAATSVHDLDRIFDRFRDTRPDRLVLTKIDEAGSLSPLVGLLRSQNVPISYLGTGQRVPEDLERATGDLLAACVVGDGPVRQQEAS
jgi:flagellar biosynthesis protein FlhF